MGILGRNPLRNICQLSPLWKHLFQSNYSLFIALKVSHYFWDLYFKPYLLFHAADNLIYMIYIYFIILFLVLTLLIGTRMLFCLKKQCIARCIPPLSGHCLEKNPTGQHDLTEYRQSQKLSTEKKQILNVNS